MVFSLKVSSGDSNDFGGVNAGDVVLTNYEPGSRILFGAPSTSAPVLALNIDNATFNGAVVSSSINTSKVNSASFDLYLNAEGADGGNYGVPGGMSGGGSSSADAVYASNAVSALPFAFATSNDLSFTGIGGVPEYPLHVHTNVGGVSIFATNDIVAFSDLRLKANLSRIEGAASKIDRISGYTYERTDAQLVGRECGLIAQELIEVLPEAVHINSDGYMSIAYGKVISLLVEGFKELRREVAELRDLVGPK